MPLKFTNPSLKTGFLASAIHKTVIIMRKHIVFFLPFVPCLAVAVSVVVLATVVGLMVIFIVSAVVVTYVRVLISFFFLTPTKNRKEKR